MVGFPPFQQMNEIICQIKGTSDGNWGNICVLAVGDLYQLPSVAQCSVYMQPHNINTLNDFASNGWQKMQLHELTQVMRQNDMAFVQCLNNIWTKVPEPGSAEDIMLQACELKVGPDDETYPKQEMHVYVENVHCNVWNNLMLNMLPGQEFVIPALDGKRDVSTNLAKVQFSDKKQQDTGNLRMSLSPKVGARAMITKNIDVSDGLTNGAMGTVTDIVLDTTTAIVKIILVKFNYESIGQEACSVSMYKNINKTSVPIQRKQASFTVGEKESCQGTRTEFHLALTWAVTIHKCQGLTLPEIVVDMTTSKGKYRSRQAYVAFSHVHEVSKLHIINYTCSQIHVCEYVAKEMERLRKNWPPEMPLSLFDLHTDCLKMLHLNIGNINVRLDDIQKEKLIMMADIISFNETHLYTSDVLSHEMLGIEKDVSIF